MNILQKFEQQQLEKLKAGKQIDEFAPGDTVRVNVRIIEGNKERIQAYEGLVIARKGSDINASFTVRKISNGEGVERVFPLYSPRLESVKLVRKGVVRRAKLYYIRDLTGKAARIEEKRDYALEVIEGGAANDAAEAPAAAKAPKQKKAANGA